MPLSEHEQRLLDEMERGLYGREADVVQAPTSASLRPNYRAIVAGVLVAAVGLAALVAGVMTQLVILGVVGFVVMFTGALISARPASMNVPDSLSETSSGRGSSKAKSKRSTTFMQRMESRWDDRQDGRL